MSNDGFIDYRIQNIDNFAASFYVELINCTNNLNPVPAQHPSLEGLAIHESNFDISTTNTEALEYTCLVILKDSNGTEVDTLQVGFSTTPQVNLTVDQGNTGNDLNGDPASQEYKQGG
mmetsp:Transcript_23112/g.20512  ORF Transcript_23112/g.20512 Transcript_23112/m.20512 type:complete len:118 (+) Transcript_23112:1270-1623(+)